MNLFGYPVIVDESRPPGQIALTDWKSYIQILNIGEGTMPIPEHATMKKERTADDSMFQLAVAIDQMLTQISVELGEIIGPFEEANSLVEKVAEPRFQGELRDLRDKLDGAMWQARRILHQIRSIRSVL